MYLLPIHFVEVNIAGLHVFDILDLVFVLYMLLAAGTIMPQPCHRWTRRFQVFPTRFQCHGLLLAYLNVLKDKRGLGSARKPVSR